MHIKTRNSAFSENGMYTVFLVCKRQMISSMKTRVCLSWSMATNRHSIIATCKDDDPVEFLHKKAGACHPIKKGI